MLIIGADELLGEICPIRIVSERCGYIVRIELHGGVEVDFAEITMTAGVPGSGGLSGSGRRVRDVVSHRAMVSENDQELT